MALQDLVLIDRGTTRKARRGERVVLRHLRLLRLRLERFHDLRDGRVRAERVHKPRRDAGRCVGLRGVRPFVRRDLRTSEKRRVNLRRCRVVERLHLS